MGRLYVRVLGRLTLIVDGESRHLTPTSAAVFIRLLVARGALVTVEELFRDVWRPAPSARISRDDRVQVQKRILEIRSAINARGTGPNASVLVTDRGRVTAYRLCLPRDHVDAYEFEDLIDQARSATADTAGTLLHDALTRWLDRPLLDVDVLPFAADAITGLDSLRAAAERDLAIARAATAALATGAPTGDVTRPPDARSPHPTPRQLPPDVRGFAGRSAELAALHSSRTPAVPLTVVSGTAGVGKTALAVRFAHQVADQFPDGQLYIDLCGYDPGEPVTATVALAAFLRALGVTDANIPTDNVERSALFRSLSAGRRMLLLLDNAASVTQIRALLPGDPSCRVIVTSRDSLAGLVARDGAHRLILDLLPPVDAMALLRLLIGGRIDAEPDAAASLTDQCARLPLALRIVAEIAVSQPTLTVADLVNDLADEQSRLGILTTDADDRTAVRAVFAWSLRRLTGPQARLFALLGTVTGSELNIATAAVSALVGTDARPLLDALTRAHLVHPRAPGRHGMHDLLRAYARECADRLPGADRRAATTALADYYLAAAAAAMDVLVPHEQNRRPRLIDAAADRFVDPSAARAWLDTERANLLATAAQTVTIDHGDRIGTFAATLWRYLDMGSHHADALTLYALALDTARTYGDRRAEANARNDLGRARWRLARYDEAADDFRASIEIRRNIGDEAGEGAALMHLGLVERLLGRFDDALEHLHSSLALTRRRHDRTNESRNLNNIGDVYLGLGRLDEADTHFRAALTIHRDLGDHYSEGIALGNLGLVNERRHADIDAEDYFRQALTIHRTVGYRTGEAEALGGLGTLHARRGNDADAIDHLCRAADLYRATGDPLGEGDIDCRLGLVHLAAGRLDLARAHLIRALDTATKLGNRPGEAAARNGLGEVLRASGDHAAACAAHRDALVVAVAVNDPIEQARAHAGLLEPITTGDR